MPWMGPLPAKIDEAKVLKDFEALHMQIFRDVSRSDIVLNKFVCRKPEFFGPVPQMEAVRAFLHAWPDGDNDQALVTGLSQAATAGNWMARIQLYNIMRLNTPVAIVRHLQTAQWMQRKKLGPLYAIVAANREDYIRDQRLDGLSKFDVYAAFHGSYPAQNKIGQILTQTPSTAAIGRAMLDCASNTVPEYGRIFSGEAKKAAQQKREDAIDARLPPLQRAVRHGDVAELSRLIAATPGAIDLLDIDGHSPLDAALLSEPPAPQIVKLLIAKGARVSEDHWLEIHSGKTQISIAADAPAPLNLELVKLLMDAGSDPFVTTSTHREVFETAFGRLAENYESGRDEALFEYMLSTKRMAAPSALATAYVDQYASSGKTLDRLLEYGAVPSGSMFARGADVAQSRQAAWLSRLRDLLSRYPHLRQAMTKNEGAFALARSVRNCEFDLALAFSDMGAPLREGTIGELADHCSDRFIDPASSSAARGRAFLEHLATRHYELDAAGERCVAWLPDCRLPGNGIVRELLALGADPYRLGHEGKINAVLAAVSECNLELAELMLATPPKRDDAAIKASLTVAADRVLNLACCAEKGDNKTVLARSVALARLISYGAAQPTSGTVKTCKDS